MLRLSSDWTLFLKFFLPTVWITFFGVATGMLLFTFRPGTPLLAGALLFYFGGIAFLYFTLLALKRVEGTEDHLYVTNYFKTFRYTFDSVDTVSIIDILLFKVVVLHFKEKTSFGRRVYFIRRKGIWEEYLLEHEELARNSVQK